jgi:hypothetical protein
MASLFTSVATSTFDQSEPSRASHLEIRLRLDCTLLTFFAYYCLFDISKIYFDSLLLRAVHTWRFFYNKALAAAVALLLFQDCSKTIAVIAVPSLLL